MMRLFTTVFFSILCASMSFAQPELWGTGNFGGLNNDGFIFKTDSTGDNLRIVHHFQQSVDGENISALTLGSNGKLYGVAASGGLGGNTVYSTGTLFEYDLATDEFRVLEHFGPQNTKLPLGMTTPLAEGRPNLYEVSPGVFYILFYQGRYVYLYNVNTGVFTKPFNVPGYQGGAANGPLQNVLNRAFIKGSDGFLYASTSTNSVCPIPNPNMGSIIRVNPANNAIAVIHRASCLAENGYGYQGFLAETGGKFYATASQGGANHTGVIYAYAPATSTFTKLFDFPTGISPFETTSMVKAANGKLYGTSHGGGIPEPNISLSVGGGTLFEFDPATNAFSKKHNFTLAGQSIYDMGVFPSGLISSTNQKLYGATQYGVFEFDPATDNIRVAGRFEGLGFAPSLMQVCRKPAYKKLTTTTYTICEGAAFSKEIETTNTRSVVWRHDNVIDATRTTTSLSFASFTPGDAGTWICTLENDCGETVVHAITLEHKKAETPTITAGGPLSFCEGGVVTLSAPGDFDGYEWSNGMTTQHIDVTESGSYALQVSNGCESDLSPSVTVTVNPLPPVPTRIVADKKLLTATGPTEAFAWSLNDVILEGTASQIQMTEPGVYKAYSMSEDGCRSEGFASITILVTGIESAPDEITVYPNPVHEAFHVRGMKVRNAQLTLISAVGRVLLSRSITPEEDAAAISVRGISPGLYTIMIQTRTGTVFKRITIQ